MVTEEVVEVDSAEVEADIQEDQAGGGSAEVGVDLIEVEIEVDFQAEEPIEVKLVVPISQLQDWLRTAKKTVSEGNVFRR